MKATTAAQWEHYLKPISSDDIENTRKIYQNPEKEELDLIREFKIGNGRMSHLLNSVPDMRVEDENRIIESLRELMSLGKIPNVQIKNE